MNLSPQHANYSAQSTGTKIKKKKRWDDQGVSATIGTIMSLLVFLTFLGMFTNQFLPVWMNDNESGHMAEVIGQFTSLKSTVDISISNYANSLVAPSSIFVPVTLSAPGIPVFAASTAGIMTLTPHMLTSRPWFNVSYVYIGTGPDKTPLTLNETNDGGSGGALELYCPNRYYVEERVIYENGAVILNQSDGEFIIAGPQFLVENKAASGAPSIIVKLTQISIAGNSMTIGGTGSKGVNANLQFADTSAYENTAGSTLTFTIVTQHGLAWENYFNSTLNGTAGMTFNHGYFIHKYPHPIPGTNQYSYEVIVTIDNVKGLFHTQADVSINIGELVRT